METPKLDELLEQATQGKLKSEYDNELGSAIIYVELPNAGSDAISVLFQGDWSTDEDARKLVLFATHGPALVAALKEAIRFATDVTANWDVPEDSNRIHRWRELLAELEASCQK